MLTFRRVFFCTTLLFSFSAAVADDQRDELVRRIASAQGLTQLFDQQRQQQQAAVQSYAAKVLDQVSGEKAGPNEQTAFERFAQRSTQMFSGSEMAAAWVARYGHHLLTDDLRNIIACYESAIRRKDVAATQAAMLLFSQWLNAEEQARASSLLNDFVAELRAAKK